MTDADGKFSTEITSCEKKHRKDLPSKFACRGDAEGYIPGRSLLEHCERRHPTDGPERGNMPTKNRNLGKKELASATCDR